MKIMLRYFELAGSAGTDTHDLTRQVQSVVTDSGIQNGSVIIHTPGSTAGVTTIEYESGALADLKDALERLAPADGRYAHNERWGDGNGYSHVRSALLGPSLTVPVAEGLLVLGTWQQVVVLDFDNRARRRKVAVQVMGE